MMSHDSAVLTPTQPRKLPPGPRGYPLLGVLPKFARNPLQFLNSLVRDYGEIAFLAWGSRPTYFIHHPDFFKHVLQENNRNYRRDARVAQFKILIGEGLVTSTGDLWLRQRRLMQPAFHRQQLASLATYMTEITDGYVTHWQAAARRGTPLDMAEEMTRLTRDIVVKTLFGTVVREKQDEITEAVIVALDYMNKMGLSLIKVPSHWPTPRNRRFNQARDLLDRVIYEIIDECDRNPEGQSHVLSMLLSARDEETGARMDKRQIRDEAMTLFLAGHETTAVLMAWAWYVLASNPDVERQLHEELHTVLGGRAPTFDDLPRLAYTRMLIDETLRLYPPTFIMAREANTDDEIGGYAIPADAGILLSPYLMHRDAAYWENPEQCDPLRFLPERSLDRPRFTYVPFGGGPRMCIGNSFALMEAQLILATIAQRYRLAVARGWRVEPQTGLTLRPRGGLPMMLHRREV
jgi:cytochrome P450